MTTGSAPCVIFSSDGPRCKHGHQKVTRQHFSMIPKHEQTALNLVIPCSRSDLVLENKCKIIRMTCFLKIIADPFRREENNLSPVRHCGMTNLEKSMNDVDFAAE